MPLRWQIFELGKSRKIQRGRPKKKWKDQIEELGRRMGKTRNTIKSLAADRKEWKNREKRTGTRRRNNFVLPLPENKFMPKL